MTLSVSVSVMETAAKAKALERMARALLTEGLRVILSVAIVVLSQCDHQFGVKKWPSTNEQG